MGLPVGAELPLRFGLTRGQIIGDFHLVKARAPRHRVLIGDHRPKRADLAGKPAALVGRVHRLKGLAAVVGTGQQTLLAGQQQGIDAGQIAERKRTHIPAGRFGTADEFGAACAFLCSAQAGYLTGQNLLIDGGAYPGTF